MSPTSLSNCLNQNISTSHCVGEHAVRHTQIYIFFVLASISLSLSLPLSLMQEVQKELQSKAEGVAATIRSVEDFLSERGDCLSPEERDSLQEALRQMKEQYAALTTSADASVTQLDTAISTTLQQNTQRVRSGAEGAHGKWSLDKIIIFIECCWPTRCKVVSLNIFLMGAKQVSLLDPTLLRCTF